MANKDQQQLGKTLLAVYDKLRSTIWNAIKAQFWKSDTDLDLKRRKEAEFLMEGDLPFSSILGFLAYDIAAQQQMMEYGFSPDKIHLYPNFYF